MLVHLSLFSLTLGTTENYDRLECLRQDSLDLVLSSIDENMYRQVHPMDWDNTQRDIFVAIENIEIKKLSAIASITRGPNNTFRLDVSGEEAFEEEYDDVAVADLMLTGVKLLTQDTLISYGAAVLPGYTTAQLFFKLSVEGRAIYNETTEEWELELLEKEKPKPFAFRLESEYTLDARKVIQKVLNDYTSIDDMIINYGIWPAIKNSLPVTIAASFNYLSNNDFGTKLQVKILGTTTGPHKPLQVKMSLGVDIRLVPEPIFEVFSEHFDVKAIAEKRMDNIFNIENIKALVAGNKVAVSNLLARYGVPADIIDQNLEPDVLRSYLIKKAREGTDIITKSLEPYIKRHNRGERGLIKGYELSLVANVMWDKLHNDGLITADVSGPKFDGGPRNWLTVPVTQLAVPTAKGNETVIRSSGLQFQDGNLYMSMLHVKDFRMLTGDENTTARQTYKVGGTIRDATVILPSSWNPGWDFDWDESQITISKSGTVRMVGGNHGLRFKQIPVAPPKPGDVGPTALGTLFGTGMRSGAPDTLDGKVPEEFKQQTQDSKDLPRNELIPQISIGATMEMHSGETDATITITADMNAKFDMDKKLRLILAPRPTQDFGYTFAVEYVERIVKRSSSGFSGKFVVESSGRTAAIVSCGYLRLLNPDLISGATEEPLKRIIMEEPQVGPPATMGQSEMDLTNYYAAPDIYNKSNSEMCLNLHSNGYQPRQRAAGYFYGNAATLYDELCGVPSKILHLKHAIELQIRRFRADRDQSTEWNFGTHPADQNQYLLEQGQETRNLVDILKEKLVDAMHEDTTQES